jgi:hypothetical protein
MISKSLLLNCKFEILTHQSADKNLVLYNQLYRLWKQIWNETYSELGSNKTVCGDDFYFLDEFCTIHFDNLPIAMVALKWLDLNLIPACENNYIEHFPGETLTQLKELGYQKVMGLGNLIAHPDWRKNGSQLSYTDVVVGLALKRQIENHFDTAICYTRNNRSVNKLVYRLGGIPLWQNLMRHNVQVDVVVIPSEKVAIHPQPEVQQAIDVYWSKWKQKHNSLRVAG